MSVETLGSMQPWTVEDTENFLSDQALPVGFAWPHRDANADGSPNMQPVVPSYRIKHGYGFWLRTTPYFPGLFEEIHRVLASWPADEELPPAERLAELLNERLAAAGGKQADLSI